MAGNCRDELQKHLVFFTVLKWFGVFSHKILLSGGFCSCEMCGLESQVEISQPMRLTLTNALLDDVLCLEGCKCYKPDGCLMKSDDCFSVNEIRYGPSS